MKLRLPAQAAPFQLVAQQPEREPCSIYRHAEVTQIEGQSPDVVLVPVGEQNRPETVLASQQIGDVRQDHVHPHHLQVREGQASVDNHHVIAALEQGQILSDLAQAAQGYEAEHTGTGSPGQTHHRRSVVRRDQAAQPEGGGRESVRSWVAPGWIQLVQMPPQALEVLHQDRLERAVVEGGRGMVAGHVSPLAHLHQLTVASGNPGRVRNQSLQGMPAQHQDDLGIDRRDLPVQVASTG